MSWGFSSLTGIVTAMRSLGEPEQAKIFWDKKLADAERYAVSDQLLMLNFGCDHQPAQG